MLANLATVVLRKGVIRSQERSFLEKLVPGSLPAVVIGWVRMAALFEKALLAYARHGVREAVATGVFGHP